ncbi:hypothetical protein [Caldimonas tepidiphila]|uniref:hypothetical protein n=1 Tax=Caldimonas tepidiphila TaxID=2315841 RepID=UPI001300871E|nr:hypothetical protein [Caldimonas tepidiphila]
MNTQIPADDEALKKHSFDLIHFPLYLQRSVAPRVRIKLTEEAGRGDLVGFFIDAEERRSSRHVVLVADPEGVPTSEDRFFQAVHEAFHSACPPAATYIGFTRSAPPVYSPLFALAMLYKKYGRGIYRPGEALPTPCEFLAAGYQMKPG